MPICFFIGHRDAPESVYPSLLESVRIHAEQYGVTEFLVGHYGAFDFMAARAVLELKKTHPGLRLTMLLPYHPAERTVHLPAGFDGSFYPSDMENVPRRLAIVCANVRNHVPQGATLLVAGTAGDSCVQWVADALRKSMPDRTVLVGGSLLESVSAIEGLYPSDSVLLVERCGVSRYSLVKSQIEAVLSMDKQLIGCVTLEK